MQNKITQLQALLEKSSIDELLICDKMALYYLIGIKFDVGERFIALHISTKQLPTLYLNELFPCPKSELFKLHSFKDGADILSIVANNLTKGKTIGIDKVMKAGFVLPIMQSSLENEFVLGSFLIDEMRLIKDEAERVKMRKASLLNDQIMSEVKDFIKIGMCDFEIEEFIYSRYKFYQVEPSFEPIVAFKSSAANPHASANGQILSDSDVVLVDMGCIVDDYCSDMTRSFVINNPKLEELYQIVLEANMAAIAMIKPGVSFSAIDQAARSVIAKAGYQAYFTHRTGHGIGLEVHEPMDVSSVNAALVAEGMCFSIEPGIYIDGVGGIRIEDLVIVTSNGCEVLNHYPK